MKDDVRALEAMREERKQRREVLGKGNTRAQSCSAIRPTRRRGATRYPLFW